MINPSLLKKQKIIVISIVVLILATFIIGMGIGSSSISYNQLILTLLGHGNFMDEFVLFDLRLPRMIITLFSGMALAISGAILQGITRNDLADPGIIGINSGAGVAIAIYFLFSPVDPGTFTYLLPVVAFIGALLTSVLIYLFSYSRKTGLEPVRLVLIGFGFSMALSGLMIVLISFAGKQKVDFISKWLSGDIWGDSWPFVWAILPWLLLLIPVTFYMANRLNLLGVNEHLSIGVGLSVEKERLTLLFLSVALAAAAVSVTGGIAFIGLIAPHIAKSLIGPRAQLYMPIAILTGGWLLLISDLVGHNIGIGADGIPAGVMIALFGAPYFIYLLTKKL